MSLVKSISCKIHWSVSRVDKVLNVGLGGKVETIIRLPGRRRVQC